MPTVSVQKTRNAETITKTAIDQKQSLELVQTMLHGGLSSLSYLREFFAEKAFDEQRYDADKIYPYQDYAAGKLPKRTDKLKEPSTAMRILRRGRSKRVDVFLDWLEKGAFPALKAGYLRALQIYVHADPADRAKVIEMYTFTIKYASTPDNGKALAGLEMDSSNGNPLTVGATNLAFQTLLRQIMELCKRLPDLPENRYVSMELFYINDDEKDFRPQGFVPGTTDSISFAQAQGWEQHTEVLHELNSQFHDSTLRIRSLINPCNYALRQPTAFPDTLQYGVPILKQADIDVVHEHPRISEVPDAPLPGTKKETTANTPAPTSEDNQYINELREADIAAPDSRAASETVTDAETEVPTQALSVAVGMPVASQQDSVSSNMLEMRTALQNMMHPESMTQGDTQTQSLMQSRALAPSVSTETPSRYTESPPKPSPVALTTVEKPALSPTKVSELEQGRQRLKNNALEMAKKAGRKMKTEGITMCQCGYQKEEDEMVCCTYCGTWQHLHCYGYTGADDPRLPDSHTCYHCLLGDHEADTLQKLKDIVMKRRAMHFALQHGLTTQQEFAADLELEQWMTGPLFQYLKRSGFVVDAAGSHKAGYRASGKPLFVAVRDGPKHEQMLRELFDPLLHIGHHYQLPPKPVTRSASLTERLHAAQSKNMPPPATPASQLRKKKSSGPVSSLESRRSVTPLQTPIRPRTQQMPQKRPFDDDEETEVPEMLPMFKRMKTVQSQFLLDANGLPSSPADIFSHR